MAPYTARGRERVQIFSEDGIEQCACRSNCWEKSVARWTNVVHTQYILPVGAEVSSYNWQKRVLQRVALINWWNSCFYFSWYTQVYGPKTELLMPRPVGILDITGNLTLLAHLPAWHPPPSPTYQCVSWIAIHGHYCPLPSGSAFPVSPFSALGIDSGDKIAASCPWNPRTCICAHTNRFPHLLCIHICCQYFFPSLGM